MACPQAAGGGYCLHIWTVAADILNRKQVARGGPPGWGVGGG